MSSPDPRAAPAVTAARILVIEDEKDLARMLQRRLELDGYRVVSVASAESGLKIVREDPPALILLDIVLPGMDGVSFLRLIRRETKVPVILLSGRSTEVDRIVGLKAGADDYVAKPFSIGELLARMDCILRRGAKSPVKKRRHPAG